MSHTSVSLPLSILLIEPHGGTAARLHDQVLAHCTSAVDVGRAQSLREGMNHLCTHRVNLVLMDLTLPDYKGLDAIRALRMTVPDCALIAMTTVANDPRGLDAIRSGAHEFLSLTALSAEDLRGAIARALARNETAARTAPLAAQVPARVVHDLNNTITSINGFADILLTRFASDNDARACAERIRQAGARATMLVKALTPVEPLSPSMVAADPSVTTQAA